MVNVDFTREFDFILGLEVSEPQSRYNRYRDIYKQAKSIFLRSPTIVFVYNVGYNYIFLPPPPLITRFFRRRLLSKTSLYTIIYLIQNRPSLSNPAARPGFCLSRTCTQPRELYAAHAQRPKQGLGLRLLERSILYKVYVYHTCTIICCGLYFFQPPFSLGLILFLISKRALSFVSMEPSCY